ncbi:MAG: gamma-glutamylcyclotransferase (GGCT)/AIG2-like uncharacterized protein YtfP [Kiritimatiellia bacterium]
MNQVPVFVYGTLMHGESRAGLLGDLARRPATVRGCLYHLPAGYPALDLNGDDVVHGQIVSSPSDQVLRLIDQYEGVDRGVFNRVLLPAVTGGLMSERCWAWTMRHPRSRGGVYLPHGRWRAFRRR